MLATLRSAGDLAAEQRISSSTREATAALATTMHACQSDAMALRTAAFAIVVGSLVSAATLWMWLPLLWIITIAPLLFFEKTHQKIATQRTLAAQQQPGFDQQKYRKLAN
jgi:hypothetical protein